MCTMRERSTEINAFGRLVVTAACVRAAWWVVLAAGVAAAPGTVYGQASPWLAAGHWTGPTQAWLHAGGRVSGDPVAWVRTEAAAGAGLTAPYRARLAVERGARGGVFGSVALGWEVRDGAVRPGGFTPSREWTGPTSLADERAPGVAVQAAAVPLPWLALSAAVAASHAGIQLEQGTVGVSAGVLDVWAGRRAAGWRPGSGGLVLHGVERLDGAGVGLARPVEVPLLGAVSAEALAGPVGRNGGVARPWLLGMRVHARPHARLDAGATRAALFGGLGGSAVGFREVAAVLVGANLDGRYADDQVASLDARWRPPLGAVAVELYGEWGMHDIDPGVLVDVPAFTLGARLPGVFRPARAELGLGVEHTQVSGACCGNPPWYHHFELADGWVVDGAALGHPLGGQGREWRASVFAASADAAVLVHAAGAVRMRGAENVYAPARQGRALLLDVMADVQGTGRLGASLELHAERGSDWREMRGTAAVRWRL